LNGPSSGTTAIVAALTPQGVCTWAKAFTGNVAGTGIVVAPDGSLVVVGRFYGTLDFGGNVTLAQGVAGNNTFAVKLTSDGAVMGSPLGFDLQNATDPRVAVGPGGDAYIAGSFSSGSAFMAGGTSVCAATAYKQGYVVHLDPTFALASATCLAGASADAFANGVAADGAGNVVLLLSSAGNLEGLGGTVAPGALIAVKTAQVPPSSPIWVKSFAPDNTQAYATGIAVDGMGNVVISANENADIDVAGGTLPANQASVLQLAP
jgi:hypothetical protein